MAIEQFSIQLRFDHKIDWENDEQRKGAREAAITVWQTQLALQKGSQVDSDSELQLGLIQATAQIDGKTVELDQIVQVLGNASFADGEES